jgi:sulfonate transport system permease protein
MSVTTLAAATEDRPTDYEELAADGPRRRRKRLPRELRGVLGPLLILAVWAALSWTGVLGGHVFPAPQEVVSAAIDQAKLGTLGPNILASMVRAFGGLAIGVAIGVVVATIAGLTRWAEDSIDSVMQVLKAIPNFALLPLLIIWLGIGETPKITLVVLATAMPIYVNMYSAIRSVDARLVDLSRTLGLSRAALITNIVLPGSLPGLLTGLRIAVTNAWLALIYVEAINAPQGLGKLMSDARSWYRLDIMVLVICLYAILGLLSYAVVQLMERVLLGWRSTMANS